MPIEGKLGSLYTDKEQTQPLFPRTKTKAITDDDNIRLDITLDSLKTAVNSKASEAFVMNAIANAQLGGGSGDTEIDLSGYATKDDIAVLATKEELNAIDFPVDSVNGKTGTVTLNASDIGAQPALTGLTSGMVMICNTSGQIATSSQTSTTELNYLNGTTSNIQTQLNTKYQSRGTINSSSSIKDLDDAVDFGFYWVQASGVTNTPFDSNVSRYGHLEVLKTSTGGILQRFTQYGSTGITAIYERDNVQTGWKAWKRIDGKFVRLWANSSPTSSFASQTILTDGSLSKYTYVIICATWDINNPHRTLPCHIAQVGGLYNGGYMGGRNPSSGAFVGRSVDVATTGITFAGGYSGTTSNNSYCIPYAVFGVTI